MHHSSSECFEDMFKKQGWGCVIIVCVVKKMGNKAKRFNGIPMLYFYILMLRGVSWRMNILSRYKYSRRYSATDSWNFM
jgi:hypothetical protein